MEINSVLFGAGRGKRLRPLTDRIPKPALPLLDVPLAAWSLRSLTRAAATVIVNASHLPDELLGPLSMLGFGNWTAFVETPDAYGTAGTLRALRNELGPTFLTWNGDVLTDLDPRDLLAAHGRSDVLATLAVRRVRSRADLEIHEGRVVRFIDRRRVDAAGAQFLGIAAFAREALQHLPDRLPAGLGETLLKTLAGRGAVAVHEFTGYWLDVGTPAAYLQASVDVLNGATPPPPVPAPGDVVEVTGGRAYVSERAEVARESLGTGAIVLAGARVEPGAHVDNAIVFSGERVPSGAEVHDGIWFDGGLLQLG